MNDIDYLFRFFGYGKPDSPLWFVGIEEGGVQGESPHRDEHKSVAIEGKSYYYDPSVPNPHGDGSSPLWRKYQAIAELAGLGPNYFLSNMAPLARGRESHMLEGVVSRDYVGRVIEERIPALRELVLTYKPRAVLFHGKGAWTKYHVREAFKLPLSVDRVQYYSEQRLIFTRFLTQGLSNIDMEGVVAKLREWMAR